MSIIITTQELDAYTGKALDAARSAQMVAAVNKFVERTTNRSWGALATITDELHDDAPVIFLRHQDVTEVLTVKRGQFPSDQTTLQSTQYFCNDLGRLVLSENLPALRARRDDLRVSYKHGVADVPEDLKLATLALAADFYNYAASNNQEITAEAIGSYRLSYASGQSSGAGAAHFNVIKSYRTRRA